MIIILFKNAEKNNIQEMWFSSTSCYADENSNDNNNNSIDDNHIMSEGGLNTISLDAIFDCT